MMLWRWAASGEYADRLTGRKTDRPLSPKGLRAISPGCRRLNNAESPHAASEEQSQPDDD